MSGAKRLIEEQLEEIDREQLELFGIHIHLCTECHFEDSCSDPNCGIPHGEAVADYECLPCMVEY